MSREQYEKDVQKVFKMFCNDELIRKFDLARAFQKFEDDFLERYYNSNYRQTTRFKQFLKVNLFEALRRELGLSGLEVERDA